MKVASISPSSGQNSEDAVINNALAILDGRIRKPESYLSSPTDTKNYLKLKLAEVEHEVFGVLFLDTRHGVIKYEELFRGTVDSASVYPREVVKAALAVNASALIIAHNHPSGVSEPSLADQAITRRLKEAMALVDIRLLDHLVVGNDITSFAERGLL